MNCHADNLSRVLSPDEWQLHPGIFQIVYQMWGPRTVDKFALELTTQLPRYNSMLHDPSTSAVDALAQQDWQLENNWVNPPFWMLSKILAKIWECKAESSIVAPWWPAQPWFRQLQNMSIADSFRIPNSPRSMLKRVAVLEPLIKQRWKIYIWRIHGGCPWGNVTGRTPVLRDF